MAVADHSVVTELKTPDLLIQLRDQRIN